VQESQDIKVESAPRSIDHFLSRSVPCRPIFAQTPQTLSDHSRPMVEGGGKNG
jgi:hypothetical protein